MGWVGGGGGGGKGESYRAESYNVAGDGQRCPAQVHVLGRVIGR